MTDDRGRFLEVVTGNGIEHSGGLILEGASRDKFALRLKLRIKPGDDVPAQFWTVRVKRSYREGLSFEWTDSVYLGRAHSALIPYVRPEAEILIHRECTLRARTSGHCQHRLPSRTRSVAFHVRFPERRFGPGGWPLWRPWFAWTFPVPVATRIVQDLKEAPIRPVVLNERAPCFRDGAMWGNYSEAAEALVFGSCFVAGEGFRVEAA